MPRSLLLYRTEFGSRLFGTALPTSDVDYKAIVLPPLDDLLLARPAAVVQEQSREGRNEPGDVDVEVIPVHRFVSHFVKGQTYALELAFSPALERELPQAPDSVALGCTPSFRSLVMALRSRCLTREIGAMVGYCRSQAHLYGGKGERLAALDEIVAVLSAADASSRLGDLREQLPLGTHSGVLKSEDSPDYYQVLNSRHHLSITVGEAHGRLTALRDRYGGRSRRAADSDGADWKALMHACRVLMEAEDLLTAGRLCLPFVGERLDFLMDVRLGRSDRESVSEFLDEGVARVEGMQAACALPPASQVKDEADALLLSFVRSAHGLAERR